MTRARVLLDAISVLCVVGLGVGAGLLLPRYHWDAGSRASSHLAPSRSAAHQVAGHAHMAPIETVLHIMRVAPGDPLRDAQGHLTGRLQPGYTFETWTDVTCGCSKEINRNGWGHIVGTSYLLRRPGGAFTYIQQSVGQPLRTQVSTRPFWLGGERSLKGMQAEYARHLAGAHGAQTLISGVAVPSFLGSLDKGAVVRRFDAQSADGIAGTIWLTSNGLPVQVEANHDPNLITRFPLIEERPRAAYPANLFTLPSQLRRALVLSR